MQPNLNLAVSRIKWIPVANRSLILAIPLR